MKRIINYKGNVYKVEGDTRSGFAVYKATHQNFVLLGRSTVETAYKAIIDVLRKEYSSFY